MVSNLWKLLAQAYEKVSNPCLTGYLQVNVKVSDTSVLCNRK